MKKRFAKFMSALLCGIMLAQSCALAQEELLTSDVISGQSAAQYMQSAVESLEWYKIQPKFGVDTNVCEMLENKLAQNGYDGITAGIKSAEEVYSGGGIDENGDITYFFADPDESRFMWSAGVKAVFTLSYEGETLDYAPSGNIIIGWDEDKIAEYIDENIIAYLDFDLIKGENTSVDAVTLPLSLPQYVNNNRNVRISWSSSDASAVSISEPTGTVDDIIYGDYTGKINQSNTAREVELVANLDFVRANGVAVTHAITVTVAPAEEPTGEDRAKALLDALDYSDMLTFGTSDKLDENAVVGDIQLPTPTEIGVKNNEFTVALSVEKEADREYINVPDVKNSARVYIFRPLPEEGDKTVSFTITLESAEFEGVSASKEFSLTIKALDKAELETAAANMQQAAENLFEYIKGNNTSSDEVTENLADFYGIYSEGGVLTAKSYIDRGEGAGIIADIVNPEEPVDYRRRFISDNNDVIEDDILRVTQPEEDTEVTIKACLTDERFDAYLHTEEYPLKYAYDYAGKYEAYEAIGGLCRVPAEARVIVKARKLEATAYISVLSNNGIERSGGTLMAAIPILVSDSDGDGALTIKDALICLHEAWCVNGYESSEDGIVKLWGLENPIFDVYHNGVKDFADGIADGDKIEIALFGNGEAKEKFVRFEKDVLFAELNSAVTVKLYDSENNPVPGAKISALAADGSPSEELAAVTDDDGRAEITLNSDKTAYLVAEADTVISSVCRVTTSAEAVPVETITISKSSAVLNVGGALSLTAEIYPVDASNKLVTWSSNNPEVAAVNANGTVTAKSAGKAVITAVSDELGGEGVSCTVTVRSAGGGSADDGLFSVAFELKVLDDVLINTKLGSLSDGISVYDVFKRVLTSNGYKFTAPGGYVSSVTTPDGEKISEFGMGPNSGWMYTVDGVLPNDYMADYKLYGGEEICVFFIEDYNDLFDEPWTPSGGGGTLSGSSKDSSANENTVKTEPIKTQDNVASANDEYKGYIDVAEGSWYYDAVKFVSLSKLFFGTSENEFSPDLAMTRAMALTVLYRSAGEPESGEASYEDVLPDDWFARAAAWIGAGDTAAKFEPYTYITREQLVYELYRYCGLPEPSETQEYSFIDSGSISDYVADAVLWAAENGIVSGREDGSFDPAAYLTRAEAAVVFQRFYTYINS